MVANRNNEPVMVIEGLEDILIKDIAKHKEIVERTENELISFRKAVSHEVKRKKHYRKLIGGGKYNDESLQKSIDMMGINITHLSNRVKETTEKRDFNKNIVDTLSKNLEDHRNGLKILAEHRKRELDAATNRLGKPAG
jgi:hypothetical protein